jgi:hypothetical protein
MMKKALIALAVVFVLFWMFTDPRGLAEATGDMGSMLATWTQALFTAVIKFAGELG